MISEFEFVLRTEEEFEISRFTGHISRGILLNLVRYVNPSSSQALHESNVKKPYSVTPIYFRSKLRTKNGYIVDPSSPLSFKIRLLYGKHANELLLAFENKNTLMIQERTLRIETVRVKAKTYQDLIKSSVPAKKILIEFLTPTRFASLGREKEYLFPEQKKVYGGLLELWNQFSEQPLSDAESDEYLEWLGSKSWISSYSLRTEIRETSKGGIIGFTGWASYNFDANERWQKLTHCLTELANFSNIGKGRTAGFGVVRTETKSN